MTDSDNENILPNDLQNALQTSIKRGINTLDEVANQLPDGDISNHIDAMAKNLNLQRQEIEEIIFETAVGQYLSALKKSLNASRSTSGNVAVVTAGTAAVSGLASPVLAIVLAPIAGGAALALQLRDGRELYAVTVNQNQIPDGTTIHSTAEEPLSGNDDIQFLLKKLTETDEDAETLESSINRVVDFDTVDDTLQKLEFSAIDEDDQLSGYYVEHHDDIIVLMLDEGTD